MLDLLARWRTGILRVYFLIAVPWIAAFGYQAYDSGRIYSYNRDYVDLALKTPGADQPALMKAAELRDRYGRERDFAIWMTPAIPLGLPVAIAAILWVYRGFRPKLHKT